MRRPLLLCLMFFAALAGGAIRAPLTSCGPFTDVSPGFCPFVLTLYYSGITAGTSATTFSPDLPTTRGQAAVFVGKSMQVVQSRASRRAALGQWWTTKEISSTGATALPGYPADVKSDGTDIWVSVTVDSVVRIRASDGKLLDTWTGIPQPARVLVAMGKVFITNAQGPNGGLYMIDPSQPAGPAVAVATNLGGGPLGITFDGARIWTANNDGTVSIISPAASLPWGVTTVDTGLPGLDEILWDGSRMWLTRGSSGTLYRLDALGAVVQSIVLANPGDLGRPLFDGTNLWIPDGGNFSVYGIRPSTGQLVSTLTGNGIAYSSEVAFDGERLLVGNFGSVSLFRAADLTPIGNLTVGIPGVVHVCSDGLNFWMAPQGPTGSPNQLFRF